MSEWENAVRERVAKWSPVLFDGNQIKDRFYAGKALVEADIRPGAPGDLRQGITVLTLRVVNAVAAAQDSPAAIEIRVGVDEQLGLNADVMVRGPQDG